jgi:hypothetical protein
MSSDTNTPSFANMGQEQLPIPKHKLHEWPHFVGLYAAEHVAAIEFDWCDLRGCVATL